MGRIVKTSSTTSPAELSSDQSSEVSYLDQASSYDQLQSAKSYYKGNEVHLALLSCFILVPENFIAEKTQIYARHQNFYARVSWSMFCRKSDLTETQDSSPTGGESDINDDLMRWRRTLPRWLDANSRFLIQGKPLGSWTRKRDSHLGSLLRPLKPLWFALYTICALVLCGYGVGLALVMLASTRGGNTGEDRYFACISILLVAAALSDYFAIKEVAGLKAHCTRSRDLLNKCQPPSNPWRRLILADQGFLGMADKFAQNGDVIFYVVGCQSAVILRETQRNEDVAEDHQPQYTFVGNCYVYFNEEDQYKYCGPKDRSRKEIDKWTAAQRWQLSFIDLI